jgi:glycosyltransferase involved in cell wall biosynthesis
MALPISVIMPAYNASAFLDQAIESVLSQTWRDFELIIIDDGSTDDTLEIAQRYAGLDSRIKVYTQTNAGTAPTMNRGIDLAQGEWVFLMHADDRMHSNRLERQLAFISEHPELSVASTLVRHIDSRSRIIGRDNSILTTYEAVDKLVKANELIGFNHPASVLRKSAIKAVGGYRQAFWPAEDLDLWNRLVENGYKILVQPEFLLDYRMHGNSASISRARLTRTKVRWIKDCMLRRRAGLDELDWEPFLAELDAAPWPTRFNRARKDYAKIFYKSAVAHFAQREYPAVFLTLLAAVALQPRATLHHVFTKAAVGSFGGESR